MKKLYMFFLFLILVGCGGNNDMENGNSPNDRYINISIDEIVTDVASGGKMYAGKAVKINGLVEIEADLSDYKNFITLKTHHPNVVFFIRDRQFPSTPRELNKPIGEYKHGSPYDFYIFISRIIPEAKISGHEIWAELIIDEVDESIASLILDLTAERELYTSKIINLTSGAVIEFDVKHILGGEDPITGEDLDNTILLETNDENIFFVVTDYAYPPKRIHKYRSGTIDDFRLFIERVEDRPITGFNIYSIIVWN